MTARQTTHPSDRATSPHQGWLVHRLWLSAYALVGATILAVAIGIGFFLEGGVYGPLSDGAGLVVGVILAPLVWGMQYSYRHDPYTTTVSTVGTVSVAGIIIGSAGLIILNLFALTGGGTLLGIQFLGWGLLGVWLLGVGLLGSRSDVFPDHVSMAALLAGVGTVGGMVSLVYSYTVGSFTVLFPAFMGVFLVGTLLWAYWLGATLRDTDVLNPSD